MMGYRLSVGVCLLLAGLVGGCEPRHVKDMQGGSGPVPYPALEEFENEHLMALGYSAEGARPNWGEVKRLAAAESFKAGLSKFEAAEAPAGITPEKKQAIVDAARKLSETSSSANEEIEAAYRALIDATRAARN
jgi:hypothetical protein